MSDDVSHAAEATTDTATPIDPSSDRALARVVAIGLPTGTILFALVAIAMFSISFGLLILIGGALLGVIALFWASLRTLSGEADVDEDDVAADDAFDERARLSRKKMLLRALKDLERERALEKITAEDFTEVAARYRDELKTLMRSLDDDLSSRREKAEALLREHLAKPAETENPSVSERLACKACGESNEPDAKFCKGCAATLQAGSTTSNAPKSEAP